MSLGSETPRPMLAVTVEASETAATRAVVESFMVCLCALWDPQLRKGWRKNKVGERRLWEGDTGQTSRHTRWINRISISPQVCGAARSHERSGNSSVQACVGASALNFKWR